MSLISIQIPNLIQGVSQQPPQMRLPSQVDEQVNAYPSLTDGLTKRPPTNHVKKLTTDGSSRFVHFINRDSSERYVVLISSDSLRVFTIDGVEKFVYDTVSTSFTTLASFPSYLNSPSNIRAVTVADYTFLLNKSVAVAMGSSESGSRPFQGIITVSYVAQQVDYTVTLRTGSVNYAYTVSSGTSAPFSTSSIAASLTTAINAATATHGITAVRYGSTIIVSKTASDFSVKVSDTVGSSYIICAKDRVAKIQDLPVEAQDGFKIEVTADIDSPDSFGYFVKFVANDGTGGTGYWEESTGFSVKTALNPNTMPFALVRRADTHFALIKPEWAPRYVGDDETAPVPSFVGKKVKDVFLFRNRLGMIADDKVVLSEAGQYFNFFRTTTTSVLPSDVIDVSVGHSKIASLESAIPWDERLILFSPLTQFSLGSGGDSALTPQTVEIVQTTEFENAADVCRPEPTGRSLLFPQRRGSYSGVREYVRVSVDEKYDGIDITANVPSYISGTVNQIAVSTHDSTGFFRASGSLWNYKWFVNGTEKIQSAWSRWDLGGSVSVQGMEWIDHSLFLVLVRSGATWLERVDFGGRFADSPLSWGVHLDRRVKLTVTTTGAAGGTSVISTSGVDLDYTSLGPVVVIDGKQVDIQSVSASQIVITGEYNSSNVIVGIPYSMSVTMLPPYPPGPKGVVIDGRFQVNYMSLSFEDTGHFTTTVQPKYRSPYAYTYSAGNLGSDLTTGAAFLSTSSFRCPIHCKANEVKITVATDSFLPCRIQTAAFEGVFSTRNRPA